MAKTYEYNPDGSYHILEDSADGLLITQAQDVKASLDWAQKQRNHGHNDRGGLRDSSEMKHYATVSMGAILKMREAGIDFWNKDHEKAMLKWIEKEAPRCKVTNRKIM